MGELRTFSNIVIVCFIFLTSCSSVEKPYEGPSVFGSVTHELFTNREEILQEIDKNRYGKSDLVLIKFYVYALKKGNKEIEELSVEVVPNKVISYSGYTFRSPPFSETDYEYAIIELIIEGNENDAIEFIKNAKILLTWKENDMDEGLVLQSRVD